MDQDNKFNIYKNNRLYEKEFTRRKKRILEIMSQITEGWRTATNDIGEPMGREYEPDEFDPQFEPEDDDRKFNRSQGMGNFNDIDWKVLHEQLMLNTELIKAGSKSTKKDLAATVNDLTDDDGMLSLEELQHLDDFGLINMSSTFANLGSSFPIIEDKKYFDFNAFKTKALEIWKKDPNLKGEPYDPPTLRYRDTGGTED